MPDARIEIGGPLLLVGCGKAWARANSWAALRIDKSLVSRNKDGAARHVAAHFGLSNADYKKTPYAPL